MTQTYEVDTRDLAAVAFSVNAQLSFGALLYVGRSAWVPSRHTKPLVVPVLREVLTHLHVPLQRAIAAVRDIGPQTTLAELQRAASEIERSLQMVEDGNGEWVQSVNRLYHATGRPLEIPLEDYGKSILSALEEMKSALSTNDTGKVLNARIGLLGQAAEASRLNRVIEALMERHDITDAEVGYTFRGR